MTRLDEQATRYTTWSPREIEIAASMWQSLFADHHGDDRGPPGRREQVLQAIGDRLGCGHERVWTRMHSNGPSFNAGGSARNVSAKAIADREARRLAADARSITGSFFGDPPPGFSALDQKRSGVQR